MIWGILPPKLTIPPPPSSDSPTPTPSFSPLAHLGDANANGIVDIQDQSIITNHWQQPATSWSSGDLNLDGFVDLQDLTLVTNNWQQPSAFPVAPDDGLPITDYVPAPEPTSLLLLLLTLPLLARLRPKPRRPY